jgi:hypothetical protein
MSSLDVLAALLVLGAAASFLFGAMSLARANDVEAIFYLLVGILALRAGTELVRTELGA